LGCSGSEVGGSRVDRGYQLINKGKELNLRNILMESQPIPHTSKKLLAYLNI
jgi:hypothetical protein